MTRKTKTDRADFWLGVVLSALIPAMLLFFQLTGYSILSEDSLATLSDNTKLQGDTLAITARFSEQAAQLHLEMMGNLAVLYAAAMLAAWMVRLVIGFPHYVKPTALISKNDNPIGWVLFFGISILPIFAAFYWAPPFQLQGSRLARAIQPGISDIAYHALFVSTGVIGFYSFVMAVIAKVKRRAE